MTRKSPDNHHGLPDVFIQHLKREVQAVERFMKWVYAGCAGWTAAAVLMLVYSREIAVFTLEHWN